MIIEGPNTIGEQSSNPYKQKYLNPPRDWLKCTIQQKCRSCWAATATQKWNSIEKAEYNEKS